MGLQSAIARFFFRILADNARARIPCDYFAMSSEVREDTRRAIDTDSNRSSTQRLPKSAKQLSRKGTPANRDGKKGKPSGKGNRPAGKDNRGKKGKGDARRQSGKGAAHPTTAPPTTATRSPFWKGNDEFRYTIG